MKTAVRAKRYASNVGIKAVQEIIGAVYTKAAAELARTNSVKLINKDQLIKMLLEANNSHGSKLVHDTPSCPRCKIPMVLRKSRKGDEFYGCSNFPSCRQTKSVS